MKLDEKKKYENKFKTITEWWTLTLKRKRYTHVTIVTNYVKKMAVLWNSMSTIDSDKPKQKRQWQNDEHW